jgi:hypothetical protein
MISPLLASIHGHDSDVLSLFLDFLGFILTFHNVFQFYSRLLSPVGVVSNFENPKILWFASFPINIYQHLPLGLIEIWYLRTSEWFNMLNHPFPREIRNFLRDMPHAPFSKTSILGLP